METAEKSSKPRLWPWLILVIGILHFVDWLYDGRTDFHNAMSAIGFLLMTPAAFADSDPAIASRFHATGRGAILRPMMYLGAALALTGIIIKWV